MTYATIKKKVGAAWALIYNPEYSEKNGKLLKGELKEFSTDKNKLLDIVSKDKNPKKHFTVLWFGVEPDEKILLNI